MGLLSNENRNRSVVLVLLVDALLLMETLLFGSSFFSSNCTMPLFAIYLVWLACQQQFGWRELLIVVLMNLFFLVTYPEFMVVLKAFEVLAVLVALWRRNRATWLPLVAANVICLVMHPLAIFAKVKLIATNMSVPNGWNVIGNPVLDPIDFIADLVGMRYGQLGAEPLQGLGPLRSASMALVLCQMLVGLAILAKRFRVAIFLVAWLGLLVAVHARAAIEGTNQYAGFKLLSHTYFVLILAAAAPLFTQIAWPRRIAGVIMALWLATAGICCYRLIPVIHSAGYSVKYTHLCKSLAKCPQGKPVAVLCAAREPLFLVNMVGGESNFTIAVLTSQQKLHMKTRGFADWTDSTQCQADGTFFDGIIVVEREIFETHRCVCGDQLFSLEPRRVLSRVEGLVVCEGTVLRANAVNLPRNYWIWEGCSQAPQMFATGDRFAWSASLTSGFQCPTDSPATSRVSVGRRRWSSTASTMTATLRSFSIFRPRLSAKP